MAGRDPPRRRHAMSKLIRMDQTGHSTLAEWTAEDPAAVEAAVEAFRAELERGYLAMVSTGPRHAEQVRGLPVDAPLVILRLPISGGCPRHRGRRGGRGTAGGDPAGGGGGPLAPARRRRPPAPPGCP